MPLKRIWIPSPNYSSRGGARVRLIVLHTAEGARTIESLGSWFQNPTSGVSSHAGADDKPNTVGEYVHPLDKAWTQANANPVAVSLELCAFAAWDIAEWNRHTAMLANTAAWIAEEAARFGIPIVKLTAAQAQGSGVGVCQHSDLGAWGGGHHDCGPAFTESVYDVVLELARGGSPPAPQPPTEEEIVSVTCGQSADGAFHVVVEASDGSLWETWQKKNQTAWSGGKPGVAPAGLTLLAKAPPV